MTNELIEKYACALKDEEEAFTVYRHIAKWDKENKATIMQIMSEEIHHYEIIHGILFANPTSAIETAYMNVSAEILEAMKECYMTLKK